MDLLAALGNSVGTHGAAAGIATLGTAAHHAYVNSGGGMPHHNSTKKAKTMDEPTGTGNTPATGTLESPYRERFVPVNFPDKMTITHRYASTYSLESIQQAGTIPTLGYVIWNTNNVFAVEKTKAGSVVNPTNGAHQPNQRDNWVAQFGYYRVCDFKYKITAVNCAQQNTLVPTNFTNAMVTSQQVVTVLPTQNTLDITATNQETLWEMKHAQNHLLQGQNAGSSGSMITLTGHITPEDYDLDPVATAADETWTAIGSNPTQGRYLAVSVTPAYPSNTTAKLPEAGCLLFVEFWITTQYAGYFPALRETAS